jgi:hypothetical protein
VRDARLWAVLEETEKLIAESDLRGATSIISDETFRQRHLRESDEEGDELSENEVP